MPSASGSAAQQAYEFTKWAILNGVFDLGELVAEGRLADEIGVSRTPVREALLRLEVEGLVRLCPEGGAVVCSFSVEECEDILEARVMVENFTAARSFAGRAALLPRLESVHADMARSRQQHDTAGFSEKDRCFHELIVDAAGNAVLSRVYAMLRERQTLFTSVVMRGRTDRMDAALEEHSRIMTCLRGDDEAAFVRAVNDHLDWALRLARASVRPEVG